VKGEWKIIFLATTRYFSCEQNDRWLAASWVVGGENLEVFVKAYVEGEWVIIYKVLEKEWFRKVNLVTRLIDLSIV
jgi:hypothetical protein